MAIILLFWQIITKKKNSAWEGRGEEERGERRREERRKEGRRAEERTRVGKRRVREEGERRGRRGDNGILIKHCIDITLKFRHKVTFIHIP